MEAAINEQQRLTFGLRDMLLLVAVTAVLFAGVVLGTWAAWIGSFLCGAAVISQLITVLVGRDLLRAGAIGFLVPVSLYLICTVFISDKEYSFYGGVLPHTQLMQQRISSELKHVDSSGFSQDDSRVYVARTTMPRLALVHLLTSCVVGYAGLRYAKFVFMRSRNTN